LTPPHPNTHSPAQEFLQHHRPHWHQDSTHPLLLLLLLLLCPWTVEIHGRLLPLLALLL
jgi:hypothetical protein